MSMLPFLKQSYYAFKLRKTYKQSHILKQHTCFVDGEIIIGFPINPIL